MRVGSHVSPRTQNTALTAPPEPKEAFAYFTLTALMQLKNMLSMINLLLWSGCRHIKPVFMLKYNLLLPAMITSFKVSAEQASALLS